VKRYFGVLLGAVLFWIFTLPFPFVNIAGLIVLVAAICGKDLLGED
jgi:hypothetical protein